MSDQHITLYDDKISNIVLWSDGTMSVDLYRCEDMLVLSQEKTKEVYLKMKEFFEGD